MASSSLRIGAAWWKQDRNGNAYLSLSISSPVGLILQPDSRLSLFANPNKQQENQPDFELVILGGDRPQYEQDDFSPDQAPRGHAQPAPPPAPAPRRPAPVAPEDVPYQAPPARRQAAPPPVRQAAAPARQATPAGRFRNQAPTPPPDYDPTDGLDDPFAE